MTRSKRFVLTMHPCNLSSRTSFQTYRKECNLNQTYGRNKMTAQNNIWNILYKNNNRLLEILHNDKTKRLSY